MIEFRRTPLAHSLIQLSSAFFARSLDTNITTISTARLQQLSTPTRHQSLQQLSLSTPTRTAPTNSNRSTTLALLPCRATPRALTCKTQPIMLSRGPTQTIKHITRPHHAHTSLRAYKQNSQMSEP